ncbi:hypothetical protein WA158_002384 [Blastocystis sp. Blastoise]
MSDKKVFTQLVLIRHGESEWNSKNLFTGWTDVPLSAKGEVEAHQAGKLLKEGSYVFDEAYTSLLKRAIKTLWISLEETDQMWIPVTRTWRLNERHYGALQGLNKQETVDKFGIDQVMVWRRSYDVPPPAVEEESPYYPKNDRRYESLSVEEAPKCESLKTTGERFLPIWDNEIFPKIKSGKRIVIAAHGNSLRALVMHLDHISEKDITGLNIPTGVPLVYDFDEEGNVIANEDAIAPLRGKYLGDRDAILASINKVANQTKKH